MTEDQLRDRLQASAGRIDHTTVPLGAIRASGRAIARRRTAVRVALGVATTAAAVTALALAVPASVRSSDEAPPAITSTVPSGACPSGLVGLGDPGRPSCLDPFPEPGTTDQPLPGGLRKAYAGELRRSGAEQRRAVEDDHVTDAEYRAGFERYRRCLAGRGHELGAVLHDGLVFTYVVPGDAVASGADRTCYDRYWQVLDMVWQERYADRILARDTLTSVNICLVGAGAEVARSLDRAARLLQDAGLREADCPGLLPGQIEAARG